MWSVQTIVEAFKNYQPDQYALFEAGLPALNTQEETAFIEENYPLAENISIDYAILEKSDAIYVLPASFDWNDLGTWGSLYDKLEKDPSRNATVNCKVIMQDAEGNMIRTVKDKLVVIEGLSDYIVVDKPDVLLIFPKAKEQDIKAIVARVKDSLGDQYV